MDRRKLLLIFVAAWIAQFVGHKLEGRKPSFFEDLQYLWVGPIFVVSKLYLKLGVRWKTNSSRASSATTGMIWMPVDPVPITPTRLPAKDTGSCGHLAAY